MWRLPPSPVFSPSRLVQAASWLEPLNRAVILAQGSGNIETGQRRVVLTCPLLVMMTLALWYRCPNINASGREGVPAYIATNLLWLPITTSPNVSFESGS